MLIVLVDRTVHSYRLLVLTPAVYSRTSPLHTPFLVENSPRHTCPAYILHSLPALLSLRINHTKMTSWERLVTLWCCPFHARAPLIAEGHMRGRRSNAWPRNLRGPRQHLQVGPYEHREARRRHHLHLSPVHYLHIPLTRRRCRDFQNFSSYTSSFDYPSHNSSTELKPSIQALVIFMMLASHDSKCVAFPSIVLMAS